MKTNYDPYGSTYDSTRKADRWILKRILHHLSLSADSLILDVGCGTGNYSAALADRGYQIVGVDISEAMLAAARGKSLRNPRLQLCRGEACALPFAPASFEAAICVFSLHHISPLDIALGEVSRVASRGMGRLVILTSSSEQTSKFWLKHYFPIMMERSSSQMMGHDELIQGLRQAGYRDLAVEPFMVSPSLEELFLYAGKHRPQIYLDQRIRAGISSFAMMAEQDELSDGLQRLSRDIESGAIENVIAAAENNEGDYMFVTAKLTK